jgi:hypothetical protein
MVDVNDLLVTAVEARDQQRTHAVVTHVLNVIDSIRSLKKRSSLKREGPHMANERGLPDDVSDGRMTGYPLRKR